MKAKHTPGPWRITDHAESAVFVYAGDNQYLNHVARVHNTPTKATRQANARLIAAAPDMLAMLKQLRDLLQNETGLDTRIWEDTAQELLDVISQAEGDES